MKHTAAWRSLGWVVGLLVVLAGLYWVLSDSLTQFSHWIITQQRDLHHQLTYAVTALDRAPSLHAWLTLLGLSFFYGIFHAAGPGHGKAVLATWLVSQGGAWRRALSLSCAAALLQALVAIGLVVVLVVGFGWLTREALGSVVWVERLSFTMVALLGLWLCLRALRDLRRSMIARKAAHDHHHDHDHDHDHACCSGHHHVTPEQVAQGKGSWMAVLAIGARPCSGAVLLMAVTTLLGHPQMGIAAVLVMAVGTAITVSSLGLASVMARHWAERRLTRRSRIPWSMLSPLVSLAGGLAICALGILLLSQVDQSVGGLPLLVPAGGGSGSGPFGS
ncbi:nickel/cobalt transporter [Halomonas huangheensis]|uniref:Nickel/cobalt efflux system n=1 Tax=Halomonas huangheensis TaxID=1178482 RepID=W1N9B8_9GAMM|nr:hypothetical protein [Halomonas huangheensis]ALM53938.1 hypothetical protein AR456_17915 [Halomonas huangheensis]ERL52108.1 hypothetical protein BJB45_09085 [Halomonas huangheensis]